MSNENRDGGAVSEEVTVVVNRKIKPGCEKDYANGLDAFWY